MRKLATIMLLALAAAATAAVTETQAPPAPANAAAPAPVPSGGPAIVLSPAIPGDAQFGQLPPNATNMEKLLAILDLLQRNGVKKVGLLARPPTT